MSILLIQSLLNLLDSNINTTRLVDKSIDLNLSGLKKIDTERYRDPFVLSVYALPEMTLKCSGKGDVLPFL